MTRAQPRLAPRLVTRYGGEAFSAARKPPASEVPVEVAGNRRIR